MGIADESVLAESRLRFHASLFESGLLAINEGGTATIADSSSRTSKAIAKDLIFRLGTEFAGERLSGQTAGRGFEDAVKIFLQETFPKLNTVRSGNFTVANGGLIKAYEQYSHLSAFEEAVKKDRELKVALGRDYIIKPDVVIFRSAVSDEQINAHGQLVDGKHGRLSPLRAANNDLPILHASVSCKWTMRSDRAQNARSEALNLIRNRKGKLPHIAVVTAEPMASRIASLALGTGDIDCVYHIALPELKASISIEGSEEGQELLEMMIQGRRLRDIADLPLDLCT